MSNKRGRHANRRGRSAPTAARPLHLVPTPWELPAPPPARRRPAEPNLADAILQSLAADGPFDLLDFVSTVLWTARAPGLNARREPPTEAELIDTWSNVDDLVTTAWLVGAGVLAHDAALRKSSAAEMARRTHPLPAWAAGLVDASVTRAVEVTHALGDGDAILLELTIPGARSLTVDVYIDHTLGSIVTGAHVVPEPLDAVLHRMADLLTNPHITLAELDLSTARARVEGALANPLSDHAFGDLAAPWPRCRPIVDWVLRLLPPGGAGYPRHEWTAGDRAALTARFFESPHGRALRDWRRERLLDDLLDLLDDGNTDLMRWSPLVVEILIDLLPHGDWFSADDLTSVPDLLRAFIGHCHAERGIPADLTEITLTSVDRRVPEIQRLVRELFSWDDDDEPWSYEEQRRREVRRELVSAVGSELALLTLDTEPLPDEPVDWQAIPVADHAHLRPIVEIVDATCDALFDRELRTAAHRLIVRVALGDPAVLRRGRADTAAAALVWSVAIPNLAFDRSKVLVKDLLAHLGLPSGSPSQRAEPMLRAAGIGPVPYPRLTLGDPTLLTSAQRQWIIERRDQCALAAQPV